MSAASELKNTPDAFVQCRALGHAWSATEATQNPLYGFYVWLECDRCNMVRKDIVNAVGTVGSRSYTQPDGYRDPDHDRADFRRELVGRLVNRPKRRSL